MSKKSKESFQQSDEYCGECGCGVECGEDHDHELHDFEFDEIEDLGIIHLTLDDDTELDCSVLGIFEVEDNEYIALLPEEEEEVLIYRFIQHELDDEFDILSIEDEDEFEAVSEAFQVLFLDDEDEVHLLDDNFVEYDSYEDLDE